MFASLVAKIHNAWLLLPLWARTGIGSIVAAVLALAFAFGFSWPTSWVDLQAQALAFAVVAIPTVIAVFKSNLLPGIVTWFLGTFGYAPASRVQRAASHAGLRRPEIWVRA
jgi:hypothetical protein